MFLGYLKISWLMMRSKPVRTALSLLGIYIGVMALVIILAIREGVRHQIEDLYRTSEARIIFVHPGFDQISKKIGLLSPDDIVRLKTVIGIQSVIARASSDMDVRTAAATQHAHMIGIDERFIPIFRIKVLAGRNLLPDEILRKQPVCLITATAAGNFFPLTNPIGASLDVQGTEFHVIGVVDWSQEASARTSISEADVLVPSGWLAPKDNGFLSMLEVRVRPDIAPEAGVRLVKQCLSHGDPAREDLYFVRSLEQFVERSREFNDRILGGLLGIAAISLIVGGIGVANVMVTSVTERTREVGVRKALGAKRKDILAQFLTEASVLTSSGGLLAVITGAIGINVVPSLFQITTPLVLPVSPVIGCLGITIIVGLLAGVYPASRAASLSPAEALRYE